MPALRPATLAATLSLALAALVLPPCMAAPRPAELASTTPAEKASAHKNGWAERGAYWTTGSTRKYALPR